MSLLSKVQDQLAQINRARTERRRQAERDYIDRERLMYSCGPDVDRADAIMDAETITDVIRDAG